MNDPDFVRLRHMRDAAREALSFLDGRSLDDLKSDRMLALALVKELELIGDAASKVPDELRGACTTSGSGAQPDGPDKLDPSQ